MPGLLGPAFRERLAAAMRIPVVETLFREPWTAAARRVLPSPSPQMTATAMWAPIIAWCALETLADSIDAEKPEQIALDAFDRLRLRQPLGESLTTLGFEGESAWRAAARIKVVLLAEREASRVVTHETGRTMEEASKQPPSQEPATAQNAPATATGKTEGIKPAHTARETGKQSEPETKTAVAADERLVAGLPRVLWTDPDVRWLTGVHAAGGHTYFVCEPYEELLWWLQMPALLRIAGEPSPKKADIHALNDKVHAASESAKKAEFRLDEMLDSGIHKTVDKNQPQVSVATENPPRPSGERFTGDEDLPRDSKDEENLPVKPGR